MNAAATIKRNMPEWLKNPVRSGVWKQLGLSWKLRSGIKVRIASHADWIIYNEIFVNGEYDLPIREVLKSALREQPLVVCDLGANVGYFSLRFADLLLQEGFSAECFRGRLFEGSPKLVQELTTRLAAQGRLADRFECFHGLVGEKEGSARIMETHRHFANAIIHKSNQSGVEVPYLDLSRIYQETEHIDLLKCDIEGAEASFLRNYPDLTAKAAHAVIEFHREACDVDEACASLGCSGLHLQAKLREERDFAVYYFSR